MQPPLVSGELAQTFADVLLFIVAVHDAAVMAQVFWRVQAPSNKNDAYRSTQGTIQNSKGRGLAVGGHMELLGMLLALHA